MVTYHTWTDSNEKVIAYAFHKLSQAEKNYGQIQKEALSIIYGEQKFCEYLMGRKFYLITNHTVSIYLQFLIQPKEFLRWQLAGYSSGSLFYLLTITK